MPLRPLHDRIVIRPLEKEKVTISGFIIPDSAIQKPLEGEVIAVGPGARDAKTKKLEKMNVKPGQYVLYGQWSGDEIVVDGETVLIMRETDIMGVVNAVLETKPKSNKAKKEAKK